MTEVENHFTVFIRLPFPRGDFIDPPPVAWSAAKERALWDIISRQSKSNEIDWGSLAERFEVTQSFLLQQAAWLYERQLSQVRAQMRRMGARQSATPSPAPGSVNASMVGGQAMKRVGSGGSRVPSRLSTQALGSPMTGGDSTPGTPVKSRSSLPLRSGSGGGPVPPQRGPSGTSRPLSRQSSKDADIPQHPSRRGSIQHQVARSPGQLRTQHESSESEEEMTQSRITARKPNPSSLHRRALSLRKDTTPRSPASPVEQLQSPVEQISEGSSDESPGFLPFATTGNRPQSAGEDPSATLRDVLSQNRTSQGQATTTVRPNVHRRTTSERISSPIVQAPTPIARQRPEDLASSTSDISSPVHATTFATTSGRPNLSQPHQPQTTTSSRLPLSPPHRALLSRASPRRHPSGPGSDTSPSMGSSFSDLDDASVTQSALEEALLSGMGGTTMTMGGTIGGVTRGVSGISQALRGRWDGRGGRQG